MSSTFRATRSLNARTQRPRLRQNTTPWCSSTAFTTRSTTPSAARHGLRMIRSSMVRPSCTAGLQGMNRVCTFIGDNADWSVRHLKGLLQQLRTSRRVETLHLIAHSMGSLVLGKAIDDMNDSGVAPGSFANVRSAAPDVDEPAFRQFSPAVRRVARRTTVYVSTWDFALVTSGVLHKASRVGLVPMRWDGMDVVDTGGKDTSLGTLNHSYCSTASRS